MNSHGQRYPRIALAFVLVPVLFNLYMWQNYPISAQCLMPDAMLGMGMTTALLIFGLGFGLFTALIAGICFFSVSSMNTVLKKLRISNYVRRHRSLYAALWILNFTLGSFAGFLLIVCNGDHTGATNIYLNSLQGFIIVGIAAGSIGLLIATIWSSLLDQAKKHIFRAPKPLAE